MNLLTNKLTYDHLIPHRQSIPPPCPQLLVKDVYAATFCVWRLSDCPHVRVPHSATCLYKTYVFYFSYFFSLIKPTDALISQIYFVTKLYMFRAVPLPIIRSFPLYIRHWYMSCKFDDSFQARRGWNHPGRSWKLLSNLLDIYQCQMYSGKLLMMGRGTARNL